MADSVSPVPNPEGIPGYREVLQIHSSQMSRVSYAEELESGDLVVIKQLSKNAGDIARASLPIEAEIQSSIDHPQIAKVRVDNTEHFIPHIVMEPILGRRDFPNFANFSMPEVATRLLNSMLAPVVRVHEEGFVFRDLKPDNFIIRAPLKAILTDFGASAPRPYSQRIESGEIAEGSAEHKQAREHYQKYGTMLTNSVSLGTVDYMSPEQFDSGRVDITSDVYNLGIAYYQMLAGRLPFVVSDSEVRKLISAEASYPGYRALFDNFPLEQAKEKIRANETARKHKEIEIDLGWLFERNIPAYLIYIVGKATKKDPKDRYKSAAEMKQDVMIALGRAGNMPVAG